MAKMYVAYTRRGDRKALGVPSPWAAGQCDSATEASLKCAVPADSRSTTTHHHLVGSRGGAVRSSGPWPPFDLRVLPPTVHRQKAPTLGSPLNAFAFPETVLSTSLVSPSQENIAARTYHPGFGFDPAALVLTNHWFAPLVAARRFP